jgi:hypothetical protein
LVTIAFETLRRIDKAIHADQGSAYRGWLGKVLPHIGDAYRTDEDGHRSHMGASILGQECARAIWYSFRWVTRRNEEGRMMRLLNRGHIEEGRFIAALLTIGVEVYQQDEQGKQYRISFAEGHGGGSGDGIALRIPDLPGGVAALLEFKTHNEKSFTELAGKPEEWRKYLAGKLNQFPGKGVREAKFEHFVQAQIYMRKMGLPVCVYFAVNKNADDLYAELITLDPGLADSFIDRGEKLVWMDTPPKKLSESPGFWKCRFCDHKPTCHLGAAPDRNCRTCIYGNPGKGAEWNCAMFNSTVNKQTQLTGCEHYKKSNYYE